VESETVRGLPPAAFERVVTKPKRAVELHVLAHEIVGFDTEYDSRSGALLSWQLDGAQGQAFNRADRIPITPETLSSEARRVSGAALGRKVVLVSFFSLAELQFLPTFEEAVDFFVGPRGSLDAAFDTESGRIEIVDVARWFDGKGLAEAAQAFGLRKLEWHRARVSAADLERGEFRDYALNDATLARAITLKLREEFAAEGADTLQSKTPAGVSSRVYRVNYLEHDLAPPARAVRRIGLACAWGGRAEVFARGRFDHVTEFDLSSAYPEAVKSFGEFPHPASWRPLTTLRHLEAWRGGIVRVGFAFPPTCEFPCLPVFERGLLLFVRAGVAAATLDEVRLALRLGAKLELIDGFAYRDGLASAARYHADLVARRATAKGARRVALKLLANSWTGKLNQQTRKVDLRRMRRVAEKYALPLRDLGAMSENERHAFLLLRNAPPEDWKALAPQIEVGSLYVPEWYALITGRVRAQLGAMLIGNAPVYCATDAFWTPRAIACPKGCEKKRAGPATTVRSKLAAIWSRPTHLAMHGIAQKKAATKLLRRFDGQGEEHVHYVIRRPVKVFESLKTGRGLGTWLRQHRDAKTFWDDKRKLLADGRSTRPWSDVAEFRAEQT
jgi:hypothetical protein